MLMTKLACNLSNYISCKCIEIGFGDFFLSQPFLISTFDSILKYLYLENYKKWGKVIKTSHKVGS